ncbi:fibronectin type III domain-containing protein [Myxococcus sp. Y35]|uniref:fibronectin type III domain-containing protein n=1 Tax=Pseudomyxococcus flavus TaxID=3115648 RepID=UPI003CF2C864
MTDQERATLLAGNYGTHLRVVVIRPDNSEVDLSTLLGRDWVMGAQWSETQDATVCVATVSVRRSGPGGIVSLSPMVDASVANRGPTGLLVPLLKEGRRFRIEVQTTSSGRARPDAWRQVFYGRIDEVDAGPEELSFNGRDYAGVFQDFFIEQERDYGNDTVGVAVQDVMTQIIGDNVPTGTGPGLYVPVDPMWQLGRYTQQREPVWDAVRALAEQLGWEVRLRWREGHGWALYLQSPERLGGEAVWTFGPEDYESLRQAKRALRDIRNVVDVLYTDINDRDALGNAKRKTVTSINPSSIAEYGRRYMQVAEASASNINTEAEAQRLADAAIADLSDSSLTLELELPYFWPLEINDMVRVEPDGVTLGAPVELAVVNLDHTCSGGIAKTKLQLRGRPATSVLEWRARDAAPLTAHNAALKSIDVTTKLKGPDAPSDLQPTPTVNGFALAFKPPSSGPEWDTFELHVSTSPGFTPSASTLKAAASTTRFEVADLVPGTTYYAVVRGRDAHGNVGPASEQVEMAPRYATPADFAPHVSLAALPPNADFESAAKSGQPDTWTPIVGEWGVDVTTDNAAYSGSRALRFIAGRSAQVRSQPITVRGGDVYSAEVWAMRPTLDGANLASLVVRFYSAPGVELSTASRTVTVAAASVWERFYVVGTVPAGARFVAVSFGQGSGNTDLLVDSVRLENVLSLQPPVSYISVDGIPFQNGFGQFESPPYSAIENEWPGFYMSSSMDTVCVGVVRVPNPAPATLTTAFVLPPTHCPAKTRWFSCPTSANTVVRARVTKAGAVEIGAGAPPNGWVSLEAVRFRAGPLR